MRSGGASSSCSLGPAFRATGRLSFRWLARWSSLSLTNSARKLLTKRGRALYRLRSQTIEPIFGQIKTVRGCDRFMRRGHEAARSEWRLICGAHNLPKLFRSGKAGWN